MHVAEIVYAQYIDRKKNTKTRQQKRKHILQKTKAQRPNTRHARSNLRAVFTTYRPFKDIHVASRRNPNVAEI